MASRYSKSSRTSSNTTDKLHDQFIRQLTEEAQKVMRDLSQQFANDLQARSDDFLKNIYGESDGEGIHGLPNITSLFNSASKLFLGKPKTSKSSTATLRSNETDTRFKLSQAQALAEAGVQISKGDKNL